MFYGVIIDLIRDDGEISFEHGRYLHMTFFCQQSIEKALKEIYFETQKQTPPREHDPLAKSSDHFFILLE